MAPQVMGVLRPARRRSPEDEPSGFSLIETDRMSRLLGPRLNFLSDLGSSLGPTAYTDIAARDKTSTLMPHRCSVPLCNRPL
jgi:hypothetical protein